ncbi:MYND_finger domain-containing protein [Hexamita inflata]|uniref:MYND finger domain-containing protein n=1 Tax=Hexamita inflata TaxID=28002 RepID=A0AA86PB41_9EUKA|nr:MYND finger domain-containing protein [Hexamita inflata]
MSDDEILLNDQAVIMIKNIQKFQVYQLGSQEFLKQHSDLQKLNMQAHRNYAYDQDEWVSELFNTYDKWDALIFNLITCFQFRTQFMPTLMGLLQKAPEQHVQASILLYSILFHEAVILDLLATRAVDQLPQTKYQSELADYLTTKLDSALKNKFSFKSTDNSTLQAEMLSCENDLDFKCTMTAFILIRAFACQKLPLQTQYKIKSSRWHVKVAQILTANNLVYERTIEKNKIQKLQYYEDGNWLDYEKMTERHFKIFKTQGQLLVACLGLSMMQDQYSKSEAGIFDVLKSKINESMIDQLPQLKELKLFYERLSFSYLQQQSSDLDDYQKKVKQQFGIEEGPQRGDGVVMIDVVSPVYCQIETLNKQFTENKLKMNQIPDSESQKINVKSENGSISLSGGTVKSSATNEQIINTICIEIFTKIKAFNVNTQTLENDYDKVFPMCTCGQTAKFRCAKCKQIWYCGRECQVKDWKEHKKTCGSTQKKEEDEIQKLLKKIEQKGDKVEYDGVE